MISLSLDSCRNFTRHRASRASDKRKEPVVEENWQASIWHVKNYAYIKAAMWLSIQQHKQ